MVKQKENALQWYTTHFQIKPEIYGLQNIPNFQWRLYIVEKVKSYIIGPHNLNYKDLKSLRTVIKDQTNIGFKLLKDLGSNVLS